MSLLTTFLLNFIGYCYSSILDLVLVIHHLSKQSNEIELYLREKKGDRERERERGGGEREYRGGKGKDVVIVEILLPIRQGLASHLP